MTTGRTTNEYVRAYRALDAIAERLRRGRIPLDELEGILRKARAAHGYARDRIKAVARLAAAKVERPATYDPPGA